MPIAGPPLERPVELSQLLAKGLSAKPNDAALVSFESKWSWRELDAESLRLAANYLHLGLKPGDRIASLLPNRGALIVHYLACLKAGLVATPLNYRYQAPEIDHALEVGGAAAILAHAEREDDLANSKLANRLPRGRISFAASDGRQPSLEDFLQHDPLPIDLPAPPDDAPAFIYFTSGSTGKPKGVTHSRESLGWMIASAVAGMELTPHDIFLPGHSASHIAASLMSLAALAAGARVDVARTFDGTELLPLLRSTRPSVLSMLPSALFGLVRDHGAARNDFSSLRLCLSGGDKVSGELEREFTSLAGFEIDEIYGLTEIGVATINPPSSPNRIGSIGRLAPGYLASVRDEDRRELPAGAEGRLWIQSPTAMVGYWNRPDATAEAIVDGWFDTGDVVTIDAEGYVWFGGRRKQIIVHDGSNICPQEVEDSLLEHAAVEAAGVVGVHDPVHGENVRAYITWRPEVARPTLTDLIQFSRARIGYKAPDEIIVLDQMPSNAAGKVDRTALKTLAATKHGNSK